jgi:hypothetical protein
MFDPRIGKFVSRDPFSNKYPSESPYLIAGNSPILYIDKDGNFKLKVTQEAIDKYGITEQDLVRTQEVIDKVYSYLTSTVGQGTLAVIANQTGLDRSEILDAAKAGTGPTILITYDNQSQYNGANVSEMDSEKNQLHYDASIFKNFEEKEFKSEDEKALAYLKIMSSVLHEYAHLEDRKMNDGDITGESKDDIGNQQSGSYFNHRGSDVDYSILKAIISAIYEVTEDGDKNWSISDEDDKLIKKQLDEAGELTPSLDTMK